MAIALERGRGACRRRRDRSESSTSLAFSAIPNDPYADPRVEVFITDGRAFLQSSRRTYDVILFALPDSLTLVSGQSALRLESYLFTREAFETVRARLNPGGVFAMYNFYRERWLVDRLAGTLQTVFGAAPCLDTYGVEETSARSRSMVVGQNGRGTRMRADLVAARSRSSSRRRRSSIPVSTHADDTPSLRRDAAPDHHRLARGGASGRRAIRHDGGSTWTWRSWGRHSCCSRR